jgi:hypothetical protein
LILIVRARFRYLEETQTPEWKRAYMYGSSVVRISRHFFIISSCRDYRGLKKRITAIRREREGESVPEHSSGDDPLLTPVNEDNESAASPVEGQDGEDTDVEDGASEGGKSIKDPLQLAESPIVQATASPEQNPSTVDVMSIASQPLPAASQAQPGYLGRSQSLRMFASRLRLPSFSNPIAGPPPRLSHSSTLPDVRLEQDAVSSVSSPYFRPPFNGANTSGRVPTAVRTLKEILPTLTPTQKKFFDKLDSELGKIESFYLDREKDAHVRSEALRVQLHELRDHRRVFYVSRPFYVTSHPLTFTIGSPSAFIHVDECFRVLLS